MFEGFSPKTIDFMWNLRFNNEKPWFEAHKDEYKNHLLAPTKALAAEVYSQMEESCAQRGFVHKVSRIYKDARRLHGSGPYKDHLWFSIEKPGEEWQCMPVFWFEILPDRWHYGLGFYSAKAMTMAKLRARIDNNTKQFEKLIAPLEKQEEFTLEGPEYVRKKPAPTEKTAPWYNKKTFSLIHKQENDDEIFSPNLAKRLVAGYERLMPLYDYFATLDADPAPDK